MNSNKSLMLGTGLLTTSLLIFELVLIRLFSVLFFSNYAFLGISVALFGLSVGGLFVYLMPRQFTPEFDQKNIVRFTFVYGLSLLIYPAFISWTDFSGISPSVALMSFLIFSLPFVLGNIVITLLFRTAGKAMNRIYFSDLLGAGLGVVLAITAMNVITPISVILLAALFAFLGATVFAEKRSCGLVPVLLTALLLCINVANPIWTIRHSKLGTESAIFTKSNSFSRITVIEEAAGSVVDSIPPTMPTDDLPKTLGLRIDSDAYTPITELTEGLESVEFLKHDLSSIAAALRPDRSALVIGAGGGRDVMTALLFGHEVTAVEINPIIARDVMQERFADFSGGLYNRPDVDLVVAEGRSFLEKSQKKFAVINLPLVDTWAATSQGSLFLVEGYLYTVEAMEEYLSHLEPDGILTISRWDQDGLRLMTLFFEAAKRLGIADPENKVAVLNNVSATGASLNSYLFKLTPFTEEETETIRSFAALNDFTVKALPEEMSEGIHQAYLSVGNRQSIIDEHPNDISLVTDDRPFFFFTTRLGDILSLRQTSGRLDGGLTVALLVIFVFTLITLTLPLILLKLPAGGTKKIVAPVGYFTVLGIAFMFVEMALIQKFVLILEHPIYSYSVILIAILIFAGIGSAASEKLPPEKTASFVKMTTAIVLTSLIVLLANGWTADHLTLPLLTKAVIAIIATAPIAFFMGTLMPLGMNRLRLAGLGELLPWCWAANGAASVLASVIAIIIALAGGFILLFSIGLGIYLLAPLCAHGMAVAEKRQGG